MKTHQEQFKHQVDKIILGLILCKLKSKLNLIFTENDSPKEEATKEGLAILEKLGFSINKKLTTGNLLWLGSMIALTKENK